MKKNDLIGAREAELMQPYYDSAGPFRPRLMKFIGKLDILEVPKGKNSTVYMMFDPLITDEMLDVLEKMDFRTTIYVDQLARRCNKPVEEVARIANELAKIGIIEFWPDEKGVDRLYLVQLCVGSMEYPMAGDEYFRHEEEAVLFEHYTQETYAGPGVYMPMSCRGVHRTVPVEAALKSETKTMEWEELTKLIKKNAHGIYGVGECICRRAMKSMGRGTGEPTNQWCMGIGHWGDYLSRVGKGHRLTEEEFFARLKEAEDRGFVHNVAANANGTDIEYVCNCDARTCLSMRADQYTENYSWARNNFVSQVDPEKCTACGRCVEICPMNAVKLGQRLQPKEDLYYHYIPSAHESPVWGKDHHHPDYGHERINVWPETGTAPCKTACPAHIAVEGYLRLAALGRYDDALKLIKYNNPLPAVCGAICNRRCESACTRGQIDEPLAIDEVKKFLAYRELNRKNRYIPKKDTTFSKGARVAIIGGGPAGLSAAYYLEVMGDDVTIFEKNQKPGGMLQYGIPSFRLEKDIVDAEIDVIRELGAEIKTGVEVGKDITIQDLRNQGYKAIYLAIGMQGGRNLGVPGEDAEGIQSGVSFMRETAMNGGASVEGNIVVVGGGNVAVDVARTAVRGGAKSVQMFCLESRDIMPAAADEVEEAEAEGIAVNCGWGPKEILAENGHVTKIVFKRCTRIKDEEGRFSPQYDENDTVALDADIVLTAIGQSVQWGTLLDGLDVELKRNKTVLADGFTYQTTEPDIFVGGDAFTGARFAIDAIAAGKQAAESMHRYAWGGSLDWGRDRLLYKDIDKENVEFGSYDNAGRQIPGRDTRKKLTFEDDREVFTEEQVKAETARCLRCGASHVDENKCIGCAVCTTRCEFDAIHIRRVFDGRPAMHEYVYGQIAGEAVKRVAWCATHKPNPPKVAVGPDIDPNISHATGAVYHREGSTEKQNARHFRKEKIYDKVMEGVDTRIKKRKGTVDIKVPLHNPGEPEYLLRLEPLDDKKLATEG